MHVFAFEFNFRSFTCVVPFKDNLVPKLLNLRASFNKCIIIYFNILT